MFKGLTPFPERECLVRSFSTCASVNRGSTWKVILPSSYRGEDVSGGWLDPSIAFFFILRYFEKFLPLIDGTGALLLISMLIVLLLLLLLLLLF